MEFFWAPTCLAVLLCLSMKCDHAYADADDGVSWDQGGQLRLLWLLSIKESELNGEVLRHPHPIRGIITPQLLYCRVGIGFHLQILASGTVGGVHEPTEHSLFRVFAVQRGVVGMRGVKSGLYLCMNEDGIAHGLNLFSSNCLFKETLEENHYTTYSSLSHAGLYLALSHRGLLKRANTARRHQACTHFLPRQAPPGLM